MNRMPRGNIINRESFLENIREKIGGIAADKPVEKPNWSVTPQRNILDGYDQEQLITVLRDQCKNIHTDFYNTNLKELPVTIKNIMDQYDSSTIVYSEDTRFEETNLSGFLAQLDSFKWDRHNREDSVQFAERADIGLTFSDITLAESGTVVLLNDKGQGRSVSLLPANYMAIIPKSTIVKRMTQATDYIHQKVEKGEDIASCINFITK